jgi:predicted nucleic acid-binding protein
VKRVVVSDTSCMIDLRKAGLLEALLRLPYTFVMPNTLFEDEWMCLSAGEKRALCALGLEVHDLAEPLVKRASRYFNEHARLRLNDCFALVLAEEIDGCILLTGDGPLRRIAEANGIEVRGVLWVTDELEAHRVVPLQALHDALRLFHDDALVFLPPDDVLRRIRRLARLL